MFIPEISDGQIAERLASITILCERKRENDSSVELWEIAAPKKIRGSSFIWSPEFIRKVDKNDYVSVKKVRTLHTYGYYGYFKPSLAEVLAQAPDDFYEYSALSISGPSNSEDLNRDIEAMESGFHMAEVTYYLRSK